MYGLKRMIEQKLSHCMTSIVWISGVTFIAFSASFLLDGLCRYIDEKLTPCIGISTFVINLDNARERLNFFKRQLDDYNKFSAVDWREISVREDNDSEFRTDTPNRMTVTSFVYDKSEQTKYIAESLRYPDTKLRLTKKYFRKNDIGCFFSHLALWNECYKKRYDRILVFEDDVVLKPFFRTKLKSFLTKIPEDFDIAFLGYHDDFSFRAKPLYRVGTHAYVINLKKSKLRLFLSNFYNVLPLDYMIWMATSNLNCYFNKKQILAINEEFRAYVDFNKDVVSVEDLQVLNYQIQRFFEIYFPEQSVYQEIGKFQGVRK